MMGQDTTYHTPFPPLSSSFRCMFLLSSCTCFSALSGSAARFYMFFCSAKEVVTMFFVLLELLFVLLPPSIRNLNHPNIEYGTIHWYRFTRWVRCDMFCIQITPTAKTSKPAVEPSSSPQGCTVRPRKCAGQSSWGERYSAFLHYGLKGVQDKNMCQARRFLVWDHWGVFSGMN
jgi:hypothetical protein